MLKQTRIRFRINVVVGAMFALGMGFALRPVPTQAQSQADADQNAALQAVAKMMEGQRTYYQKNGQFKAVVSDLQQDFGITLPATFNYAVRTSAEAAYSYVIPAQSTPYTGQLKAYVGAAFLTPNQNPKITTIICQNTMTGQVRPADPTLARSTNLADPKILTVQCGDYSVQVPMSKVNE